MKSLGKTWKSRNWEQWSYIRKLGNKDCWNAAYREDKTNWHQCEGKHGLNTHIRAGGQVQHIREEWGNHRGGIRTMGGSKLVTTQGRTRLSK